MSIQSISRFFFIATTLTFGACNSPPTQPGPIAGESVSTIGRWSGSFTAQDQTSGGQARLTIGSDGKVDGSLVDSVWQAAHGVGRTGIISGSVTAGVTQVTIGWSTSQTEKFEGMASAPSFGSMGINLRQYGPDGNFAKGGNIAFALHQQGVAAGPPYGKPDTTQPNFMDQYVGRWTVSFYTGDGNAGTGTATIAANGDLTGVLVDDAWADSTSGLSARHGSITGKIDDTGKLALGISWNGSAAQYIQGTGYFQAPESVVFLMGKDIDAVKLNGPALTMTLGRD
ncbi:MAG: hypothetical protein RLZZ386_1590 [Planctomycetota bacterium]|jgi:hypothetical protein